MLLLALCSGGCSESITVTQSARSYKLYTKMLGARVLAWRRSMLPLGRQGSAAQGSCAQLAGCCAAVIEAQSMQLVHPCCAACVVARAERLLRLVQILLHESLGQRCGAGRCEVHRHRAPLTPYSCAAGDAPARALPALGWQTPSSSEELRPKLNMLLRVFLPLPMGCAGLAQQRLRLPVLGGRIPRLPQRGAKRPVVPLRY